MRHNSTSVKIDLPVNQVRRYLEPGPIVLVSSQWRGKMNVMTLGWHTVMEFTPSLIGCMISAANYSFDLICKSGECVINLPTTSLADTAVGIGNCSGADLDKFKQFNLTTQTAKKVKAPLISECYANFECLLYDADMIESYNFFIFEVVKAHVATTPKHPETLHYKGRGQFMTAGAHIDKSKLFKPEMLL